MKFIIYLLLANEFLFINKNISKFKQLNKNNNEYQSESNTSSVENHGSITNKLKNKNENENESKSNTKNEKLVTKVENESVTSVVSDKSNNNKKLEKPVLNYYICNNNIKLGNNIEVENKAGI